MEIIKIIKEIFTKQHLFNSLLGLAALVISIIALCQNSKQQKSIESLTYTQLALEHRPFIEISPADKFIRRVFLGGFTENTDSQPNRTDVSIDSIMLGFKLKNTGNTIARLYALVAADAPTGSDTIRQMILSGDTENIELSPYDNYYLNNILSPNDSLEEVITLKNIHIVDNKNTIHMLVLFRNEAGNLFDSYYCVRMQMLFNFVTGNEQVVMNLAKVEEIMIENANKFVFDSNLTSHMYTSEEIKRIDKLKKDLKN